MKTIHAKSKLAGDKFTSSTTDVTKESLDNGDNDDYSYCVSSGSCSAIEDEVLAVFYELVLR